jgi:peptidoglycan/xylan/chitin deacetylase (PgdA/CDA1 family)
MPPTPSEEQRAQTRAAGPVDPPAAPEMAVQEPVVPATLPGADLMAPPEQEPGLPGERRSRMALLVLAAIVGVMLLGVALVVVGFAPAVLDTVVQRRAEAQAVEASRTAPGYALTGLPKVQRKFVSTATSLTTEQAVQARWGSEAQLHGKRLAAISLDRYLGVVVRQGDPSTRMVAITFDDGPSKNTTTIVKQLSAAGAKATFFFVGSRAKGHWQQTQQVLAAGSEIGSHTWDHVRLVSMTNTEFDRQTVITEDIIERDTSFRPKLLRAMHGDIDAAAVARAKSLGLVVVNWSVHGGDTDASGTLARITLNALSAGAGDIILLHETNPLTAQAVPAIIRGLQERGLRLVTVSQLLGASTTFRTERPLRSR